MDRAFRNAAEELRVEPGEQNWNRVADRLALAHSNKKLRKMQRITLAAAAVSLVLVALSILIALEHRQFGVEGYAASLTDLQGPVASGHAIYSVEDVRAVRREVARHLEQ